MKILVLSSHSDRPEAYLYVELKKRGFELVVLCDPSCPFIPLFLENGIRTIEFKGGGRINPRTVAYLRRLFKNEKPSVCHYTNTRLLSNGLIASIGIPMGITAYRGTSGHLSRLDPLSWLTYLNPKISKVWCVSNAVRTYMHSVGVPKERTIAIHKGHIATWYKCDAPPSLESFGVPKDAFIVACIANVRPVKGVDVLVNAINYLKDDSTIHLLLIGKVKDASSLTSGVDSSLHSRVHFTDFHKKPYELLYSSHVFVMPSREREGLPKALLEAMAVGIPPIVTNVGGMPEVVRDGIEGLVIPPSDAEAIAKAITRFKNDSEFRLKCSENSKKRLNEAFSLELTVEKVSAMFREVGT